MSHVDDVADPGSSVSRWALGEARIAGSSHVGCVREVNQDAFGRFDATSGREVLVVVADGLGGHRGGEVASRLAVARLGAAVFSDAHATQDDPAERLRRSIAYANASVLQLAREDLALDGMGTTVVSLLLAENGRAYVGHVGDSRLYRLRGGSLERLTEDHSLVETLVREGVLSAEDARADPRRNQILRALGVRDELEIEIAWLTPTPGDHYLLCSDGLHGSIDDAAIHRILAGAPHVEGAVSQLIEAANEAGGADNITCVVVAIST